MNPLLVNVAELLRRPGSDRAVEVDIPLVELGVVDPTRFADDAEVSVRLRLDSLSDAENKILFGHWASRFNHGHNYVLWVSAFGSVDEANGMVVNIKWIDDVLQKRVVDRFDQKSINDEVPEFTGVVPCVENLLRFFVSELQSLPGGVELTGLVIEETPVFFGGWSKDNDMLSVTKVYEFAAAHRLAVADLSVDENLRLFGKCHNPNGHGHNYVVEVSVTGVSDPQTGFICDLDELDRVVNIEVIDRYDHKHLNCDVPELVGKNPTSEIVALAIWDQLEGKTPGVLERVRLQETARNIFEVNRG